MHITRGNMTHCFPKMPSKEIIKGTYQAFKTDARIRNIKEMSAFERASFTKAGYLIPQNKQIHKSIFKRFMNFLKSL